MKESYTSFNNLQAGETIKINKANEEHICNEDLNSNSISFINAFDSLDEKSGENSKDKNYSCFEHFNQGRWSSEEHKKFIEALFLYGNEWKRVQVYIKTRSSSQARSHAQKFFQKLKADLKIPSSSGTNTENDCELIFNCLKELLEKENVSSEENKKQADPIFSVKPPKRIMWNNRQKQRIINFLHNFNTKSRKPSDQGSNDNKTKILPNTPMNVTVTVAGNDSDLIDKPEKIFKIEKKCNKLNCKCSKYQQEHRIPWLEDNLNEFQKEIEDPSMEMLKFLRNDNRIECREDGSNTSLESLRYKEDSNIFNFYKNPFCIQFENFVEINKEDSNINFYTEKIEDFVKFNENIFN